MIRVLTTGTFDYLHRGHINIIRQAKEMGDYLVVGVSGDKFNEEKGKKTLINFSDRKLIVESLKWVDEVYEEKSFEEKRDIIKKYAIDIYVVGSDWTSTLDYLQEEGLCKVVYLPRTTGISTSLLKRMIHGEIV